MKLILLSLLLTIASLFAADGPTLTLEALKFTAPTGWIDVPVTSPMRKATWRTSAEPSHTRQPHDLSSQGQSDAAEISFFAFGKDQGGSVSENIQRWFSQFSESAAKGQSATVNVNNRTITFAKSEGTFTSGMPGGPTTPLPDYALCGAIIETESGAIFIKMTGPKATIAKLEKTFTELVTTAAKS